MSWSEMPAYGENMEPAANIVAEVLPARVEAMVGWTPHGVGRLAVGALIKAGWVLVPPLPKETAPIVPPRWLARLIVSREHARMRRDFAAADALRAEAAAHGYILMDTPNGTVWERANG